MSSAALKISTSAPAEVKIMAEQIEGNCPVRLQEIGKEIRERFKKAQTGYKKADDHMDAIKALMDEAKGLCDERGFRKFRERFCPQLGKSQAYVLHAIGTGRKSLAQHRTEQRDRKRKSRAKQKSSSPNSVTVTDIRRPDVPETHVEDPRERRPGNSIARGDHTQSNFNTWVMELARITKNRPPERFAETAVPADILRNLGKFLTGVAASKKDAATPPAPSAAHNVAASRREPEYVSI